MNGPQYVVSDVDLLVRNGFAWRYEWTVTLAAGATSTMGFVAGPNGAIIFDRSFFTDGDDTLFTLYRETTYTGGVSLTPANRNDRFWGDTSKLPGVAATGVTASPSAANRMGSVRLHTTGAKVATVVGDGSAIVLKPNGSYVVVVANNGTGTSDDVISLLVVQDRVTGGRFNWPV